MNLLFQCICDRKLRLILVKSSILGKTLKKNHFEGKDRYGSSCVEECLKLCPDSYMS